MNGFKTSDRTKVAERACHFVAQLYSGEMSENDLVELENWLSESDCHAEEYEASLGAWDALEDYGPAIAAEDDDLASSGRLAWLQKRRRYLAVAASFVAALLIIPAMLDSPSYEPFVAIDQSPALYQTAVGEQRVVRLNDGSVITLNTATHLSVQFDKNERRISLAFGEAYFDVAKDPSRPMIVDMGDRALTVLGTRFNVRKLGSETIVSVDEGLVAISDAELNLTATENQLRKNLGRPSSVESQPVLVQAGSATKIFADSDEFLNVTTESVGVAIDWQKGFVRFDRVPLSDVVKELNRYSNQDILIEGQVAAQIVFSGVLSNKNIKTTLIGLSKALPIEVTIGERKIVIKPTRKQSVEN